MKISIVVPAFNESKLITKSLATITKAAQSFAAIGWSYELIVCNNNSTDNTGELAQAAGAKVVFEPVNQIGRARNTGAAAATGDWLLFIDADSYPSPELMADMAAAIKTGKYVAGGAAVQLDSGNWIVHSLMKVWHLLSVAKSWAAGSFFFCDIAVFRSVGGFSHEFFAGEEVDLSNRLRAAGSRNGRGFVILRRHPLVTSGRKVDLYSPREHFLMMCRAVFKPNTALKDREKCSNWYDGRR